MADASLTVGAGGLRTRLGMGSTWYRLNLATAAGHLIECGAQATGGLWCNWSEAPDLANVGYPIAEIDPDGTFRISKPPATGGAVNRETVAEQLLYEVGDPAAYLTPDVVADFTNLTLREIAQDVVEVTGTRGKPATSTYKASIAYRDGWMASGTLAIFGADATIKAHRAGEMLLERLKRIGMRYAASKIETIGAGDVVPSVLPSISPPEVMLRVSVRDSSKTDVERFTKEFAPLVTSGPPGVTGYTTGRPAVREVFAYWPALIAKSAIQEKIDIC